MSKSIKLKYDTYIDSTAIVHNKKLLSDILNIKEIDISDIITMQSGYTLNTGLSQLYKQYNHLWGNIIIEKNEGTFKSEQEIVATLDVRLNKKPTDNGCFLSNNLWRTQNVGYYYMGTEIGHPIYIADSNNTNSYNIAKITFDCVLI